MISGSAAKTFTSQPGGTRMRRADSSAVKYGCPDGRVFTKPNSLCASAKDSGAQRMKASAPNQRRADISGSKEEGRTKGGPVTFLLLLRATSQRQDPGQRSRDPRNGLPLLSRSVARRENADR